MGASRMLQRVGRHHDPKVQSGKTRRPKQRLLVSVRGPVEARAAVAGGADIIDAEYPTSALGTVHPGNIRRIRTVVPSSVPVSTNIGESQAVWSMAAQACLGVTYAGADIVKIGLGGLPAAKAKHLLCSVSRQMRSF